MFRNYSVAKYFLMILIPLVISLGNFQYLVFNVGFYQKLYQKTGVYQTFSDREIANYATDNLLGYFRGKNALDHNFFSTQAKLHLEDVRNILKLTSNLFYLSLATVLTISIILVFKKHYRNLATSFFISSIITLVFVGLLAFGIFQVFDPIFIKFHQIAFNNNLWLFPADDNLIRLFPQQLFILFANSLASNIIFSSAIIALVSAILIKKVPK